MRQAKSVWLHLGFIASFLVIGVPYWRVPYGELGLPDDLAPLGLLAMLLIAMLVCARGQHRFWRIVCVIGAALPLAVLARIVVDVAMDANSHNLWPVELVIASAIGFPLAFVGALLGKLLRKLL